MCVLLRCRISAVLILGCAAVATAAIPNRTPQQLRDGASHVLTGKVGRIYHSAERKGNYEHVHSAAEISVASIEKGSGVSQSQLVYVRYWRKKWLGDGEPEPGHFGHRGLPQSGDVIRVYVERQSDGGFDVLSPNGFEVIQRAE